MESLRVQVQAPLSQGLKSVRTAPGIKSGPFNQLFLTSGKNTVIFLPRINK